MNEEVTQVSKLAIYLNHLKNNRIEYLIVGLIAHSLGLLDRVVEQTQGVCF